jgi:hypothetical protein
MTGGERGNPVVFPLPFPGKEIAEIPCGQLLIKNGQQRKRYLSCGRGFAVVVAIGPVDGEMDDLVPGVPDPAGLAVAKAKEFDGIVIQPFQHISVMDVADFQLAVGAFECGGSIGIRNNRGGYFEEDQLIRVILPAIEPRLPACRFAAFVPRDQEPVSYPIKKQKS